MHDRNTSFPSPTIQTLPQPLPPISLPLSPIAFLVPQSHLWETHNLDMEAIWDTQHSVVNQRQDRILEPPSPRATRTSSTLRNSPLICRWRCTGTLLLLRRVLHHRLYPTLRRSRPPPMSTMSPWKNKTNRKANNNNNNNSSSNKYPQPMMT